MGAILSLKDLFSLKEHFSEDIGEREDNFLDDMVWLQRHTRPRYKYGMINIRASCDDWPERIKG